MPPAASAPASNALDERFERLSLTDIVASKTNPRTHFDDAYLGELAGSIAEKGLVQPIIVRPYDGHTKGGGLTAAAKNGARFEVVAGECRLRASHLAKQTHIPAVIRQYTDEQVLELQLIENIHRRDLTALEQARGYRALIDANPTKHSAESIATRIGMSPAWVWDRMKLLDLIPDAKALLEQERMSAGHAILIARLKPEDQKRVVAVTPRNGLDHRVDGLWAFDHAELDLEDEDVPSAKRKDPYARLKPVSVRELEHWIHDHIRFDVEHMAKAAPLQFEPIAAKVEEAAAQPGRGKKLVSITHEYRVADDARDEKERTYGSQSWERADGQFKSKTCEHSVLGVVVAGRGQGETFDVCVARDKCRVHFGEVIRAKEKTTKLRESGKGKQAAAREKRTEQKWEIENRKREEAYARWTALKPHAIAAVVAKIKPSKLTDKALQRCIEMLMNDQNYDELETLLGGKVTAKNFTRALDIIEVLDNDHTPERFKPMAKKYRVDLAKLEKSLQPSGEKLAKKAS